jgi:hypothetical protein
MKVERWLKRAALSLPTGLALATACSGGGNSGQVGIPSSLVAAVPWTNGAVALRDADGGLVQPNEPVYPPIATGMPDPGWGPIDCTPLAAIEIAPPSLVTFEADPTVPNSVGVGEAFSQYDDGTYGSFHVTGDATWYPGLLGRFTVPWGLAAEQISNGPSCDGQPNNWAMHIRGGRFNYYGAGMEHPLGAIVPCPVNDAGQPTNFCPPLPAPGATTDSAGFPLTAPGGVPYAESAPHQYWDVSAYDGITLWARTGPEGTDGVLVAIQDKFTSDTLNRQNNKFCQRIKTCIPDCVNNAPCSPDNPDASVPTYRCFDPAAGMAPITEPAELELVYPRCGASACTSPSYYIDPDFDDTQCKPYEWSGKQAAYYCYGATPPPSETERCTDGWVASINLTTEWQIYVLPFSQFQQVGFGKPAPYMDLRSVYEWALEFPVGYVDVYIDNVAFYKNR